MKLITLNICALLLALVFFGSCGGPRINGKNKKTFKESADEIRNSLSKDDTMTFNNAIRVIAGSAMADRMRDNQQYKGMGIEDIVMKKIDGKTFGEIKSMANDTLKAVKQREIASAQKELDDFQADAKKKKATYDSLKSKLDILKGSLLKVDRQGGAIVITVVFKNVSKKDLDHYTLATQGISNSKKTLFYNSSQMYGGVRTIRPQDTLMQYLTISQYDMDQAPEIPWSIIKYPVTDPSKYNFTIKAFADELEIDDKDYDLSTAKWTESDQQDYDSKLKELQDQLKTTQNSKDNLDDF